MKEDYIYAVARTRCKELDLLDRQDMEQLLSCKTYDECLRVLKDKGWGTGTENSAEELFSAEEEKTWAFIRELTDDLDAFDVLLYPTDYNNLKAAVKCAATGQEPVHVFLPGGSVDPEILLKAAKNNDFSSLPPAMAQAASEAYRILLQTGDGQLCDVILDRACLLSVRAEGEKSRDELLSRYAELLCAVSNIKVAVRACKTGKNRAFLEAALAPCEGLDVSTLALAACKGLEEIFEYLSSTPYSQAAEKIRESSSAFEKWCDDKVMELIREQKSNPFTIGPLFAYVLARRSEIGSVRIILSGKLNELDEAVVRERLRELYV